MPAGLPGEEVTEFALQMSAEESCALSGVGLTSPPGEQGDPSACNPVSQPLVRASPLTLPNLQCQLLRTQLHVSAGMQQISPRLGVGQQDGDCF